MESLLKRIQDLEEGRNLADEARNWKNEGQKRRITREEFGRMWNEFETGGVVAKICAVEGCQREGCERQRRFAKEQRKIR